MLTIGNNASLENLESGLRPTGYVLNIRPNMTRLASLYLGSRYVSVESVSQIKDLVVNSQMVFPPQISISYGTMLGQRRGEIYAVISRLIQEFREVALSQSVTMPCSLHK
jgi:hypothetical protein